MRTYDDTFSGQKIYPGKVSDHLLVVADFQQGNSQERFQSLSEHLKKASNRYE